MIQWNIFAVGVICDWWCVTVILDPALGQYCCLPLFPSCRVSGAGKGDYMREGQTFILGELKGQSCQRWPLIVQPPSHYLPYCYEVGSSRLGARKVTSPLTTCCRSLVSHLNALGSVAPSRQYDIYAFLIIKCPNKSLCLLWAFFYPYSIFFNRREHQFQTDNSKGKDWKKYQMAIFQLFTP